MSDARRDVLAFATANAGGFLGHDGPFDLNAAVVASGAGRMASAASEIPDSPEDHCHCRRITSSCRRSAWPDPCGCGRWCGCADRGPAGPAVTQAAVAAEVHQALDVHRDFATQVALDLVVAVDRLADLQHLGVGQLVDAALGRDADLVDDLLGELRADAVDVLQRDDDALVGRDVDASDTGHLHRSTAAIFSRITRPVEAGEARSTEPTGRSADGSRCSPIRPDSRVSPRSIVPAPLSSMPRLRSMIGARGPETDEKHDAMFSARWPIDANFGYKQTVIDLMRRWEPQSARRCRSTTAARLKIPSPSGDPSRRAGRRQQRRRSRQARPPPWRTTWSATFRRARQVREGTPGRPISAVICASATEQRSGRDVVDRGHAVDADEQALGVIVADQRRGLLVVLAQALLEDHRVIVLAHRLAGGLGFLGARLTMRPTRALSSTTSSITTSSLMPRSASIFSTESAWARGCADSRRE